MRRRLPPLLGLGFCFLTTSAVADVPVLSPDIPLGVPDLLPRPAKWPGMAFDGTNYLVAWPGWAMRVSTAGVPLDPIGFPTLDLDGSVHSTLGPPGVGSNGTASLVVFMTNAGTVNTLRGRFVSKAGAPAGASFVIADNVGCGTLCAEPPRVGFDGTNYLVAWSGTNTSAARVTPAGVVLDATPLVLATTSYPIIGLSCDGTNCLVTWVGATNWIGRFVSKGGAMAAPITMGLNGMFRTGVSFTAFDGTNHIVIGTKTMRIAQDGTILSSVNTPATLGGIAWDGANVHGIRKVSAGGFFGPILIDPVTANQTNYHQLSARPYVGADNNINEQTFACAPGVNCMTVWADDDGKGIPTLFAARIDTDGTLLTNARGEAVSLFGASPLVAAPSSAGSATQGLVTFLLDEDPALDTFTGVLRASRITTTGTNLDAQGAVLSGPLTTPLSVAAASDGTDFLVGWVAGGVVQTRRVSAAGALLEGAPIDVATGDGTARVVFDGTNYGVFWHAGKVNGIDVAGYRRVSPAGTLVDPSVVLLPSDPQVASNGSAYLLTWQAKPANSPILVYGIRMGHDGTLLDAQPFVISSGVGDRTKPQVSSDGTDYFVTWTDKRNPYTAVYGARVSAAGAVLDANGIAIVESTIANPVNYTSASVVHSKKLGAYVVESFTTVSSRFLATVKGTTVVERNPLPRPVSHLSALGSGQLLGTSVAYDATIANTRTFAALIDIGASSSSSSSSGSTDGGTDGGGSSSGASSSGATSSGGSSSGASSGGSSSASSGGASSGASSGGATPGVGGDDGGGSCAASPSSTKSGLFGLIVAALGVLAMRRRKR